ncbi:alpha-amylase family glycosyl hydrolase [Actinotalea sp. AC32]|nr:alpha-amylase family glycosyl hydrolase [Actinotalea sp. AC32]
MPLAYRHERRARRARTTAAGIAAASVALTGAVTGTLATSAVAAEHDEMTVALVGDFQSELGCAGDWLPDCAETELALAEDGTYSADLDLPAGEWKYKVAFDDVWDGAYPGADVPLALGGDARVRVTYDASAEPRIRLVPLTLAGEHTEADDAIVAPPVRQPGGDERFYFVMADRFANGDPSNDTGGIEGDRLDHGFDPTNKGFYQGGDLRGIIDNLDYIEGLGTTAIWLTPSFKNRPVQGVGETASAGYHGYWITDFTQIDPHLGTNAELEELIASAEERGIKIYFDIVTNHTADVISYEEDEYSYVPQDAQPYVDAQGQEFRMEDVAGSDDFPELTEDSFPYTPVVQPGDEDLKVPAILNDLRYYHNRGNTTWAGESTTLGDFDGLDDLMTEHPDVVDAFVDVYQDWIDLGVDGFRIDTAKHVNFEFWESWATEVLDHARATGKDEFFMFGEVYSSDPTVLTPYVRDTDMSSVLDFGFQERAVAFARGAGSDQLEGLFAADDMYVTPDSSAYALPTFLGNHDMGRVNWFLRETGDPLERSQLAHSLMYLTRGQPVVYYGDEQGFVGSGGDKDARQTLFATQVEQYAGETLVTGEVAGSVDRYDTDAPLYEHISSLARLREDHPALAQGAQVELLADGGTYAFSRVGETTADLSGVVTSAPERIVDDRSVPAGTSQCVTVPDLPQEATGVLVNVTTVRPAGPGYVVVHPEGASVPATSTVNFEPGQDVANSAVVAVSDDDGLCFRTAGSHAGVVIDLAGWTTDASGVTLQNPQRVLDTRAGSYHVGDLTGPLVPRVAHEVVVAGRGGVPEGATSVLLNVTVTGARAAGNLRVYPGDEAVPTASTVNYAPGQDKANSTVVELSENGTVRLFSDSPVGGSANPVNVVLDVAGWTTGDGDVVALTPTRLVETRESQGRLGLDGPLTAGEPATVKVAGELGVPADAGAVLLNVTAVSPSSIGNLRVYPASEFAAPTASTLNYIPGRAIPNLVVADLPASGEVTFLSDQPAGGTTDLVVDVVGYVKGDVEVTEDVEYVVVANNGDAATTASFRTLTPRGEYTGVWGTTADLVADAQGDVTVEVPARSVVAFQGTRTVAAVGDHEITVSAPVAGKGLKGLVPVQATTPEDRYLETSFAVRAVGVPDWTPLGTSDNGNARVFHDVSGLPAGTLLEYRAVSVDAAGNAAAASTYASVGNDVQPVPSDEPEPEPYPEPLPTTVTVAGSMNSEQGCAGDWDPACAAAFLTDADDDGVWTGTWELPAGDYEFKAAIDGTWDVNFGDRGVPGGSNIAFSVTAPAGSTAPVTFVFDEATRYAFATTTHDVMTLAGSFQSELGCSGDWDPACTRTLLTDLNKDGVYRFVTRGIPAGSWEVKVAHDLAWTESYGPPSDPGGNYAFDVPADGTLMEFLYDVGTHTLTIQAR